jgi:hypothetical protein
VIRDYAHVLSRNFSVNYNEVVFASELGTVHKNAAIANLSRSHQAIHHEPEQLLALYCRQCSLEMSCLDLTRAFLPLANAGVSPLLQEAILTPRQAKPTRISTDIDYERDGKQTSYLRIPHSRNDSGGGTLMVPITAIKNGAGPTVLFTGGSHGDEYEGPVALMKLARELRSEEIRGRVIIIPALNLPAILAGQRLSPIDGKNMNRSFPGYRNGTITDVMAHYLSTQLLPLVDAVFDLHAGGKSMFIIPSIMMHDLPDSDLMARTLAALKAFCAPISIGHPGARHRWYARCAS